MTFPPVPKWKPSFRQPIDRVVERMAYYTDQKRDIAVFANGTCVVLNDGLSDAAAAEFALSTLHDIFHAHPDMTPHPMDDGNILVTYSGPAANVVLRDIAELNWPEIEDRHLDGLATSEVLITPQGSNVFDAFGMQALLGRAYMFMDAQSPEVIEIRRCPAP